MGQQIGPYIAEVIEGNVLRLSLTEWYRQSKAMSSAAFAIAPLIIAVGFVGLTFAVANGHVPSNPLSFFALNPLIIFTPLLLMAAVGGFANYLTFAYGSVYYLASENKLEKPLVLWGRTRRFTYTDCKFKIGKVQERRTGIDKLDLRLIDSNAKRLEVLYQSGNINELVGIAEEIGRYTGWGWAEEPQRQ